jgi:hypothetical protein
LILFYSRYYVLSRMKAILQVLQWKEPPCDGVEAQ